jgi:hypothetical protein
MFDQSPPRSRLVLIGRKKDDDPSVMRFNENFIRKFPIFIGKIIY